MRPHKLFTLATAALVASVWPGLDAAAKGPVCEARSGPVATTVVELYTSEGCSSCPPADRWLTGLSARPDVLALAFHVSYWDRLGWADRFAQASFTDRQRALASGSGARYIYTPQVIANGQDWRAWPSLPGARPSAVDLQLQRDGDTVTATVTPRTTIRPLAGHWAVLEDGHQSRVRAGENAGAHLRHDHVVRHFEPVAAWAGPGAHQLRWRDAPGRSNEPGVRRRIAFVVTDAGSGQPVQGLALGC